MRIIPAVDVLDGAAVRLTRGDYEAVTVYALDPSAVAASWVARGASLVHVVDLEAARSGRRQVAVAEAMAARNVPIQLGGGIRTAQAARQVVDAGAGRVVIGSVLVSDPGEAQRIVAAVGPEQVVAAVDVRNGRALGSGWLDDGVTLVDMAERIKQCGILHALATGIERDGTMEGSDIDLLVRVREILPDIELIASGGIGSLDDLERLATADGLVDAAIVGRALYEQRFTLEEAVAAAT